MKNFYWIIASFILVCFTACSSEEYSDMLPPDFVVGDAYDITRISARVSGNIFPVGKGVVSESGVIVSEHQDLSDSFSIKLGAVGVIDAELSDLKPATTYYYTFYASSGFSTVTSDMVKPFTTLDKYKSVINNLRMVSGSFTSVALSCHVVDDGGSVMYSCGFGYRVAGSSDNWQEVETKIENDYFETEIFNLSVREEYEFYAFAVNENGRTQTDAIRIRLDESNLPLFDDSQVDEVHGSWAALQARIVDKGSSSIAEYGFCYSATVENPSISSGKVVATDISSTGLYSASVTGCLPNTLYYCRAYAINDEGIGYGETFSFTTTELQTPYLGRNYVSDIGSTSMRVSATFSDGGGFMSAGFFCYSTDNADPQIDNSSVAIVGKIDNGNGTTSIAVTIEGLASSTVYYVRPVIIVDNKLYYGEVLTVITKNSNGTEPYIGTSFSAMNFLAASGSQVLNIYSNISWQIVGAPSWVHLSATSGINDAAVTVSVDENKGVNQRTATLKVVTSIRTIDVLLVQLGGEAMFVVSPTAMNIDASACTENIRVYSNVSWEIDKSTVPSWVSFSVYSGSSDSDFLIDIQKNNSTCKRSANIRFVAGAMEQILVINQDYKSFNSGASVGDVGEGGDW